MRSLLLVLFIAIGAQTNADEPKPLRIFAAASLTNVLDDIGGLYKQRTGESVVFSFAASSTLAKQIESGASADIFFSADIDWMDYLDNHDLINKASRQNIIGNTLVLIAATDNSVSFKPDTGIKLSSLLQGGRMAVADPDSVPAGKYARSALQALNLWDDIESKLVKADNVRGALDFVALQEAPLGIVYETDALLDKRVRIVYRFSDNTHPPIVYPIALINGAMTNVASKEAGKFIQFLHSSEAQIIFAKYGFKKLH